MDSGSCLAHCTQTPSRWPRSRRKPGQVSFTSDQILLSILRRLLACRFFGFGRSYTGFHDPFQNVVADQLVSGRHVSVVLAVKHDPAVMTGNAQLRVADASPCDLLAAVGKHQTVNLFWRQKSSHVASEKMGRHHTAPARIQPHAGRSARRIAAGALLMRGPGTGRNLVLLSTLHESMTRFAVAAVQAGKLPSLLPSPES